MINVYYQTVWKAEMENVKSASRDIILMEESAYLPPQKGLLWSTESLIIDKLVII